MGLLNFFQGIKGIFGFCPCCSEPFRLSDATLFTRGRPPETAFDRLYKSRDRYVTALERFEEKQGTIRDAARIRGQRAAHRRLRHLVPFLAQRHVHPLDVKVLFHPVEYVVFHGLHNRQCRRIELVTHPPGDRATELLQGSISQSIEAGSVEWQTWRVTEGGSIQRG